MLTRRKFLKGSIIAGGAALSAASYTIGNPRKTMAQEPKTIRFLTEEGSPAFRKFWSKVVDDFKKQTGVNVEVEYLPIDQGLKQRKAILIQAGTPPDITQGYMGTGIYIMALNGMLEPINDVIDYVERQMKAKLRKDFRVAIKGEEYVSPLWSAISMQWYREDLYQKAGIKDLPETWNAYLEASKLIHTPTVAGTIVPGGRGWCPTAYMLDYFWTSGAGLLEWDKKGKMQVILDQGKNLEAAVDALEYLKKLKEYSLKAADYSCGEMIEGIYSGHAASGNYVGSRPKIQAIDKNPAIAPFIKPMQPPYKSVKTSLLHFEGLSIFKQSKLKKESKEFIEFLYTGPRYWEMLQITPFHNLPPFPEKITSPEHLNSEYIQKNFDQASITKIADIVKNGQSWPSRTDPINVYCGPLFDSFELSTTLYNVVYGGKDSKSEVKRLAEAFRKIVEKY